MRFDVFSLFPEVMQEYVQTSILGRARQADLIDVRLHNIRDYAADKHRTTDDVPFGGGGGMVMKPEPIFSALEAVLGEDLNSVRIVLLTPQGRPFKQSVAKDYSKQKRLALICGRYEGVDERVRQHLATDEVSVGDYVLTGGEIPALLVIDATARLLPGVLGDELAATQDTYARGLLEHAHYTRPADFRGWLVPEILRSGDHARIEAWRHEDSLRRTLHRRPDLLRAIELSDEDRVFLEKLNHKGP
ncbi:MAG: tRNA (guanosine(37)-N1)-methyltransferase TrmD [Chloroflexi bacterium]|nr:tRNA (guanosine(37)-N1)-methyltransferase TrmD [Chloroflexota bacterium]